MKKEIEEKLLEWAEEYNNDKYFTEDPIIFPKHFAKLSSSEHYIQDIEIAAIFSAHFAWGRRSMIVRDCERLLEHMEWQPYKYVMSGDWRDDDTSIHRTIKWKDTAKICYNLKKFYENNTSLECLNIQDIRENIFNQKPDKKAANKKINMMRRWLVRDDKKVDLGIWKNTNPANLLIPLDVHVHRMATELSLITRTQKDIVTVEELSNIFGELFPNDPCKGDFALFGYGVTHK